MSERKHTWLDVAKAAGAESDEAAEGLLWSGSAFPFAAPRYIYGQIRHVIRHKVCYDNPSATCQSRRLWRYAR